MCRQVMGLLQAALLCLLWLLPAIAQDEPPSVTTPLATVNKVVTIKPDYLPPAEILQFLGVSVMENRALWEWENADGYHAIDIFHNQAANLLIISGAAADVDFARALIEQADVPPRQIEIEVRIVEVQTSAAKDIGFDWESILRTSRPSVDWRYREASDDKSSSRQSYSDYNEQSNYRGELNRQTSDISDRDLSFSANLNLASVLKILDESGAATVRNAPRILTLNNRRATILDGQRVTYVTRYSSYTNLFATDSMDAGLHLSVLPSLGESGYITLGVTAELTALLSGRDISGSPVKSGQMIENTIIVKDGETVLLGGLTRTIERKKQRRLPLLGHILPYIFSREISSQEEIESFIIITPRVVDFAVALDEQTRNVIDGK